MFKVVTALLNTKTDNLTIALDENQNIYRSEISREEAGIRAEARVQKLSCRYRNTKEISQFALNFIDKDSGNNKNITNKKKDIFSDYFDFHGPKPEIKQFADFEKITEYVADKIAEIVEADGCPYSEIAVLYAMKYPGDIKAPLPKMIEKALDSRGILNTWVSQDYRSKKTYDITTNSVTISTIHSVKGLDYSAVFLLALDFLEPRDWSEDQLDRLTYVAITRARYQLFVPFIQQNSIIERLGSSLKK